MGYATLVTDFSHAFLVPFGVRFFKKYASIGTSKSLFLLLVSHSPASLDT